MYVDGGKIIQQCQIYIETNKLHKGYCLTWSNICTSDMNQINKFNLMGSYEYLNIKFTWRGWKVWA